MKIKVSIKSIDFMNKPVVINSPRSIEALKQTGIDVTTLFHLSFSEFISKHPEFKTLPIDIQHSSYQHSEEKRRKHLQIAGSKREELIKEFENCSNVNTNTNLSLTKTKTTTFNSTAAKNFFAMKEEKLRGEKMKKREENNGMSMIENSINTEEGRQKGIEKLEKQRKKEEEIRMEKGLKRNEEIRMNRIKEMQREEKRGKEEKEKMRKFREKEEREKQKLKEEKEMEKIEKKGLEMSAMKQEKKQQEGNEKIELMFTKQHLEGLNQQILGNEKEKQRKEALEKKKKEDGRILQEKKAQTQKKIKKALSMNDLGMKEKEDNYYKKQRQIQEQKEQSDKIRDFQFRLQRQERQRKEAKLEETKIRNEQGMEHKKKKLCQKGEFVDGRVNKQKEKNLYQSLKRYNSLSISRADKFEKVIENERKLAYKREGKMRTIDEKMQRIDEMNKQKEQIQEEKRLMEEDIKQRKAHLLGKFNIGLQKNKKLTRKDFYKTGFGTNNITSRKSNVNEDLTNGSMQNERNNSFDEGGKQVNYLNFSYN